MYLTPYVNNGSVQEPTLEHHINLFSITGLPSKFTAPRMKLFGMSAEDYCRIKDDGFEGLQSHLLLNPSLKKSKQSGLKLSAAGIVSCSNLFARARKWKRQGYQCATIMIGSGAETLTEALAIAGLVLDVSESCELPIYLELHRGTVTQDIDIVQEMIKTYPGIRFNADFSHYITTYRWCETFTEDTLRYITPILERVCYIHLRPANSEHIQISKPELSEMRLLQHLLRTTFSLFQKNASHGDVLIVAPELLPTITGYSDIERTSSGHHDQVNRYEQSVELKQFAESCFEGPSSSAFTTSNRQSINALQEDADSPCVIVKTPDDWSVLKDPHLKNAKTIRVFLGDSSSSFHRYEELISSYLMEQSKDRRLCLETKRNTLTHDDKCTVALQRCYPDIQLSLNVGEWVLGKEVTVGQLKALRDSTDRLKNIRLINPVFATGEHQYDGQLAYRRRALFSLSVLMERIYTRFYVKLWDNIQAPRLTVR